jgi:hypothetical protein
MERSKWGARDGVLLGRTVAKKGTITIYFWSCINCNNCDVEGRAAACGGTDDW